MRTPRSVLLVALVAAPACGSPETSEQAAPLGGVDDLITPSIELGTLSGSSGVSSEGAATYDIPIDVPPGRMGMQPSLTVAYSSADGNGPLGIGFSLRGFSEVRRCPLDALHPDVVRGDAVDLCFGGRLLLVSGEHMAPGAVYRLLGDPRLRVELAEGQPVTDSPATVTYFRVSYPDGRVGLYGSTLDARGEGTWKLARLEDRAGNYMLYQYTKSANGLEHLPARINYTGSTVTGPGYASFDVGSREVAFEYEDRPIEDGYVAYRPLALGGVGLYRRLRAIVTKVDGHVVHRYRLTYGNSSITGRSHLRRIEKCDAGDACLPETDFTWSLGSPAPGYAVHDLPAIAANTAPDFKEIAASTSLDVDHDGKIELLFAYDSQADHTAARWIVWDPETGIDELPISARFVEGSGSLAPAAADFNGDGIADLIAPFCSDGHCFDNSVANIDYPFADRVQVILGRPEDPDGLATPTNSVVLQTDLRILIAATADIDGDGFPDMFLCARDLSTSEHAAWRLAMNRPDPGTGTGRRLVVSDTHRRCLASELYQVMDSDGDRRDELWVPRGNYARFHPATYAAIDPTVVDNPQVWDMLQYVGLELPYRDESGAALSVDAALALVAADAVAPTMWAPTGIVPYGLDLDFSARILRGCWKPGIEDDEMPDALYQQVLAELGPTVADQLAALYHPPSNPSVLGQIAAWLLAGDYDLLPTPDDGSNVPANVPFVHTGPSPDLHVDLNGDGLVDIARVVVLDPGTGDEVPVYDQASGQSPPYCRVGDKFDYGLGLWINTGTGFVRSGTLSLLSGHEPWRAAQLLARITPLDFNSDGRADFLTPNYGLFESAGFIDQWHILVADLTGVPDAPLSYKEVTLGAISQPWYDGAYEWSRMTAEHLSVRLRALGAAFPSELTIDEFPDLVSRATTAIHLSDKRLHDIIFFPGSDAAGAPLALERGSTRPDYLLHASDGLGAITQWDYAGAYEDGVYERGEPTDTAVPVTPGVIVRERREDLGLAQPGFMRHRYTYGHALADRRGLGSLGITRRRVERLSEGEDEPHEVTLTVEGEAAVYDAARKVYPYRGQPTRSVTDTRFHRGDELRRMVREVVTSWLAIAAPSNNTATVVEKRFARTFELGGSACWGFPCTTADLQGKVPLDTQRYDAIEVDELGNVERSSDETGDGYHTVTVRDFANLATTTSEPYLVGVVTSEATTSESPLGSATRTTAYDYDWATGLLRRITREPTDASGALWRQTELIRDVRGNISRTIVTASGQQRATVSGWDAQGYFETSTTNALGHVTARAYAPGLGLALRTSDPNGVVSETCVDGFGRKTCSRVRSSLGGPTTGEEMTYVLEPAPGVVGGAAYRISTRRNGTEILGVARDRRGRQRQRVWRVINGDDELGDAYQEITLHDDRFQVAKRSNPLPLDWAAADFPGTTFQYDETGRLVAEIDAAGAPRTYHHDGEVTIAEDADGREIHTRRDDQGRQKRRAEGGMITCFDHGPFGVLAQVRRNCDATGGLPMRASKLDHDAWSRLVRVDDPDLGIRHHAYDGFDQLDVTIDGTGKTIDFDHDALGRLVRRTSKDGLATWTYDQGPDGIGKLASSVDETGAVQRMYFFDAFGRPSSTVTKLDKQDYTIGFGYTQGLLTHIEYPATPYGAGEVPFRIRYEHDDYGNLRFIYNDITGAKLWEAEQMDGWGNVTREDAAANDFTTQRYFDAQTGRPTQLLVQDANGDAVVATTYGWTPGGNLDLRSDPTTGVLQTYKYDAVGQLERVIDGFLVTQQMAYDVFGNLTEKSDVGKYEYDAAGRLAAADDETFVYDGNGNLYTRKGPTASSAYRWTALGKLERASRDGVVATFAYDADGAEVRKDVGDHGVISLDGLYQVVVDGKAVEHRYNIRAGDRVIGQLTRKVVWLMTDKLRYLHTDYRGSVLATSDGAGQATVVGYDAWGGKKQANGGALPFEAFTEEPVGIGFGGHDAELVAGMIDLGARYYDPRLGRFHSADSVVAAPATGRDWNRYSYGRNNPLRYTDPTGHAPEDKGGGDDEPDDTKSGDGSDRDDGEDDGVCVTVDGQLYCPVDSDWAHAGGAALLGATVTGASGMDGDNRGGGAAELAEAEAAAERMARIHHQAIAEQARLDNLQLKLENMLKDALLAGRRAEVEALEAQLAQLEKDKASLGKDFGLDVDPNLSAPLVAVPGASASLKLKPSMDATGKASMKLGLELEVPGVKVTPWVKLDKAWSYAETGCSFGGCLGQVKALQGALALGELSYKAHAWVAGETIDWVGSWFD